MMTSELEIKEFTNTSIVELVLFKAYCLYDPERLEVPIFYQEDLDKMLKLPTDVLFKSFNRLSTYLRRLHEREFYAKDVLFRREESIHEVKTFLEYFKTLDERNHIDFTEPIPGQVKREFRAKLEKALQAQDRMLENLNYNKDLFGVNKAVTNQLTEVANCLNEFS